MNFETLPLSHISRISPLNPRCGQDDDVAQLAATIRAAGLKYPLIVWPRPDAPGEYEVLDGGRRWRALKSLADDDREIPVEIHDGDEVSARLVALAVSVTPRALHPVDAYEAFADLVEAGLGIGDIAKAFNETERHVRQRLALAALSPLVRDMWRKGELDRESAQAFTTGSIAAQEALVEEWRKAPGTAWQLDEPLRIRAALRGDAIEASSPIAKFILRDKARVEAYVAAGGRVYEDLFSEEIELRDGPIARRLANDVLRAEAQRVADAEGWGRALISGEEEFEIDLPDVAEDEAARLDEISDLLDTKPANAEALRAEEAAIYKAAELRAFPPEARTAHGVLAELEFDGTIQISRGVPLPHADATEPGEASADASPGESAACVGEGESKTQDTPDPLAEPGKALRAVIDDCATKGLRAEIAGRVDLALMFAVAALGCQYDVSGIGLRPVHSREAQENELLEKIRPLPFREALAECAAAPTCDLTVAFARIVAASIDTREASFEAIGALCEAACSRAADLKGAFERAFDRRAFFEAAPKDQTLRIIAGLIGAGEAKEVKGYKKNKLAEHAATLSKDKRHVPPPLSNWAAFAAFPGAQKDAVRVGEETSLADAMVEAIAADETSSGRAGPERDKKSSGRAGPERDEKASGRAGPERDEKASGRAGPERDEKASGRAGPERDERQSDEARGVAAKIEEVAALYAAPLLADFLRARVHFGNDALHVGQVKASELYDAYSRFVAARNGKRLALNPFGEAIAALGVEKKRAKTGVHYQNIALRDASNEKAAA